MLHALYRPIDLTGPFYQFADIAQFHQLIHFLLRAKINKKVLQAKSNKKDRNPLISNNNLITLVKPYPSQTAFTIILVKDDHTQNYIQSIYLPVNFLVEPIN